MQYLTARVEMNDYQKLWWQQAESDHAILLLLRKKDVVPCHQLHYLQMVTEKLGKAYFWRSGSSPKKSHAFFVKFLRALATVSQPKRQQQIADAFAFRRFEDFKSWARTVLPLCYELERLAPALAQDGPNPEYPWPQNAPRYFPATFQFDIWKQLTGTGLGRQLLKKIACAVIKFPAYS